MNRRDFIVRAGAALAMASTVAGVASVAKRSVTSRYLTDPNAWFIKTEHAAGMKMFYREPDPALVAMLNAMQEDFDRVCGMTMLHGQHFEKLTFEEGRVISTPVHAKLHAEAWRSIYGSSGV